MCDPFSSRIHKQSATIGLAPLGPGHCRSQDSQPPRSQSQAPVAVCVFGEARSHCPYTDCLNPEQCYPSEQCNDGAFVCVSGRWL